MFCLRQIEVTALYQIIKARMKCLFVFPRAVQLKFIRGLGLESEVR